jgi:hypothetical protein
VDPACVEEGVKKEEARGEEARRVRTRGEIRGVGGRSGGRAVSTSVRDGGGVGVRTRARGRRGRGRTTPCSTGTAAVQVARSGHF